MRLISIRLRNIRSYVDETIVFPDGRLLLSGDIGSGKSTILLGIEFGLFGIIRGWNDGETLLRHGSSEGSIRLEVEFDEPVTITRTLRRTPSGVMQSKTLIESREDLREVTVGEARAFVYEHLRYPVEHISKQPFLYRYTIFTPQEEMKAIVRDAPERRLELIRQMFGLDAYRTMKENALLVARGYRDATLTLAGAIRARPGLIEDAQRHEKELDEVRKDLIVHEDEEKVLQQEYSRIKEHHDRFTKEHAEYETHKKRRDTLSKEKASAQEKIRGIDNLIQDIPVSVEFSPEEYASARAELDATASKHERTQGILNLLDLAHARELSRKEQIEERIGSIGERIKGMKEELEGLIIPLMPEAHDVRDQIRNVSDMIAMLMAPKGSLPHEEVCPVCLQRITPTHRQHVEQHESRMRKEREDRKSALEGELETLKEQDILFERSRVLAEKKRLVLEQRASLERSLTKEREEERILNEELMKLVNLIRERSGSLDTQKELLTSLEERKSMLTNKMSALEKRRERYDASLMRKGLIREKESLQARIITIDEEISLLRMVPPDARIIDEFRHVDSRMRERASHHGRLLERERLLLRTQENIREGIAKLDALEERKNDMDHKHGFLSGAFSELMETLERSMMRSVLEEFDAHFTRWFSLLIDDLHGYLDESFTPLIAQGGFEVSFENLSGGEKTSVAIAYRLALHETLTKIMHTSGDVLILDEPTDGLSTEQLEAMGKVLEQVSSRQVILVSHERLMEGLVESIIRIEKHDLVSRARS